MRGFAVCNAGWDGCTQLSGELGDRISVRALHTPSSTGNVAR